MNSTHGANYESHCPAPIPHFKPIAINDNNDVIGNQNKKLKILDIIECPQCGDSLAKSSYFNHKTICMAKTKLKDTLSYSKISENVYFVRSASKGVDYKVHVMKESENYKCTSKECIDYNLNNNLLDCNHIHSVKFGTNIVPCSEFLIDTSAIGKFHKEETLSQVGDYIDKYNQLKIPLILESSENKDKFRHFSIANGIHERIYLHFNCKFYKY